VSGTPSGTGFYALLSGGDVHGAEIRTLRSEQTIGMLRARATSSITGPSAAVGITP
jgi:hypothetical protein